MINDESSAIRSVFNTTGKQTIEEKKSKKSISLLVGLVAQGFKLLLTRNVAKVITFSLKSP